MKHFEMFIKDHKIMRKNLIKFEKIKNDNTINNRKNFNNFLLFG